MRFTRPGATHVVLMTLALSSARLARRRLASLRAPQVVTQDEQYDEASRHAADALERDHRDDPERLAQQPGGDRPDDDADSLDDAERAEDPATVGVDGVALEQRVVAGHGDRAGDADQHHAHRGRPDLHPDKGIDEHHEIDEAEQDGAASEHQRRREPLSDASRDEAADDPADRLNRCDEPEVASGAVEYVAHERREQGPHHAFADHRDQGEDEDGAEPSA